MKTTKSSPLLNFRRVVSKQGIGSKKEAERLHEELVGKARQIRNVHFGGLAELDQD